ncbi:MAG: phosphoglycolate phosphatase [Betaproteobacteria bacterium]
MDSAQVRRVFVVDAVAFDLDGTLLDTVHDLAAAVNLLLTEQALPELHVDVVRNLIGKGIADLLSRALERARGVPPRNGEVAALLPSYQQFYASVLGRQTRLFPGVLTGLDRIRDAGFKLAVITNKATRFVLPHLEQAGIADYFEVIIGGDDAAAKKPDAAPLLLAAARMDVMPARMLMVGDSVNDVMAARAAGSPVLVVPYGYNEGEPVQNLTSDGIVDSLEGVADLLSRT